MPTHWIWSKGVRFRCQCSKPESHGRKLAHVERANAAPEAPARATPRQKPTRAASFEGTGFEYKGVYLPSREEYAAHGYTGDYNAAIAAFKEQIDLTGKL
jgi:hypothetical protein